MITEEQKNRKEIILKLLMSEKEFREDEIVKQNRIDKDMEKYARSLKSITKTYRHISISIRDYFDLS